MLGHSSLLHRPITRVPAFTLSSWAARVVGPLLTIGSGWEQQTLTLGPARPVTYPTCATTDVWDPGNQLLRTTRVPARFTYMWARVVRSIIYLSRNPHRANGADLLPQISGVWGRLRKTINACARRLVTFTTSRKLLYHGEGEKARRYVAAVESRIAPTFWPCWVIGGLRR